MFKVVIVDPKKKQQANQCNSAMLVVKINTDKL